MDPISAAIIAAVVAGATAGLTDTAKKAIGDAYEGFKGLLKQRFGGDSKVVQAVEQVEADPTSEGQKLVLHEQVTKAKADQDREIVEAARCLQKLVDASGAGAVASCERAVAIGQADDVAIGGGRVVKPYFGGSVTSSPITVAGGDITATTGVSGGDLRALFEPVLAQVRARPADPDIDNSEIQRTVEDVRDEAALGQAANPNKIARWLTGLGAIAPDVCQLVVRTLRSADANVSQAVRQVVDQIVP